MHSAKQRAHKEVKSINAIVIQFQVTLMSEVDSSFPNAQRSALQKQITKTITNGIDDIVRPSTRVAFLGERDSAFPRITVKTIVALAALIRNTRASTLVRVPSSFERSTV